MEVFRFINVEHRSPALGFVCLILSYLGLGQIQSVFALLCLRSPRTKHYTLPILITILVSGLVVAQTFKSVISRERPSNLSMAKPEERWLHDSFISGHTATSFAVAMMLILMTWGTRNQKYGLISMGLAVGVGYSRIYRGVHWPTDVLAGALAGIATACALFLVLRRLGHMAHLDPSTATLSGYDAERNAHPQGA